MSHQGGTYSEDVEEYGAEEGSMTEEGGSKRRLSETT
jgi:hypothetical protein